MSATACANCGAAIGGRFCADCGQDSRLKLTLATFLGQAFEGLLDLDSRFWRTLRDLAVPGKLTEAYLAGRRARYMPPVQTYLVVAVLFFAVFGHGFFASVFTTEWRQRVVADAQQEGIPAEAATAKATAEFSKDIDAFQRNANHFSGLMVLLLPAFALALKGLYLSERRDLLEHLIVALHLQTVAFLVLTPLAAIQAFLFWQWWPALPLWTWYAAVLAFGIHGVFALKRVHRTSFVTALVKHSAAAAAYLLLVAATGWVVGQVWGPT